MLACLPLLLALVLAAANPQSVLDGMFNRQSERDQQMAAASYRATVTYIETDLRSGDVKRLECERLVMRPRFGEETQVFGDVRLNGDVLAGRQRDKQLEFLRSRGIVARETRLPFFPENREEYEYAVTGPVAWNDSLVWRVEFEPVKRTAQHITGSARVLDGSHDVVSLDFVPSDLPFVVDSTSMSLEYAQVRGQWLPVRFEADMDLRLAFIIELMRKHIRIEEDYSDYAFTPARPSSTKDGD